MQLRSSLHSRLHDRCRSASVYATVIRRPLPIPMRNQN